MNAVIYTGTYTDEADINELVSNARERAPHAVVYNADAIALPAPDDEVQAFAWDEGRVFGADLELRWARAGETFRVVLTREDGKDDITLREENRLADIDHRTERAYYLWGEDDQRIGRSLSYGSIPGSGRAQVVVAEFYDAAGELQHWRYVRLQREDRNE